MNRTASISLVMLLALGARPVFAADCTVSGDKIDGLAATASENGVVLNWTGDAGQHLRMVLTAPSSSGETPLVRDLAIERNGWVSVLRNAVPEFAVTTGLRRMSNQQIQPLRQMGVSLDQSVVDKYRWDPFWDAPLDMRKPGERSRFAGNPPPAEGIPGTDQPGLPRQATEVEHSSASYFPIACAASLSPGRITVDLAGVRLGAFEGKLRFSVYTGTNLIRQEVLATTKRNWVAYKFSAGLALPRDPAGRVLWTDTGGNPQLDRFGSAASTGEIPLRARNRVAAYGGDYGAVAFFPEPHKFFWAREVSINMGYQWLRQSAQTVAFGIRQNDEEDESEDPANWALYSARPGTEQRMPMFLYPSLDGPMAAIGAALAFTRNDTYKPIAGFKVLNHHYHTDIGERTLANGTPDVRLPDLTAMKATGVNIVSLVDSVSFTPFPAPPAAPGAAGTGRTPPAPARRPQSDPVAVIEAAFSAAAAQSDADFLVWPNQEIFGSPLGGHTDLLFSHKVLWRKPTDPVGSAAPTGAKVYAVTNAAELMAMVRTENMRLTMPHPRTKGSTGYPETIKNDPNFLDPHFAGVGLRWGMGLDGSEDRLCAMRCWPLMDDMSNWMTAAKLPLKRAVSISEVRHMAPGDDIYANQPVTYIPLAKVPTDGNFAPVMAAMEQEESFWTTGEVLLGKVNVQPVGRMVNVSIDAEWTFPLAFVEVTYGDGTQTRTTRIDASARGAHQQGSFAIAIPSREARWVRVGVWDIASNGAVSQSIAVVSGR